MIIRYSKKSLKFLGKLDSKSVARIREGYFRFDSGFSASKSVTVVTSTSEVKQNV